MRAGAHRLPQSFERLLTISAEAKHAAEHADHERAVRVERVRSPSFGDRRLPFAAPHADVREDGVRHRILVVERNGKERFVARNPLHLARTGARSSARCPIAGRAHTRSGQAQTSGRARSPGGKRSARFGSPRGRICRSARARAGRLPTRRAFQAACAARAAVPPRPAPARSPRRHSR